MPDDDPKVMNLEASGTRNRHPERIRSRRFRDGGFFDPRDLLQVRYEMVRNDGNAPLASVAAEFGVSVPTCVRLRRSFREGGLQALVPRRRGPRQAHKITDEILDFIAAYKSEHGKVGARRLVPVIEERFGVSLHPRSITKALERERSKKKAQFTNRMHDLSIAAARQLRDEAFSSSMR